MNNDTVYFSLRSTRHTYCESVCVKDATFTILDYNTDEIATLNNNTPSFALTFLNREVTKVSGNTHDQTALQRGGHNRYLYPIFLHSYLTLKRANPKFTTSYGFSNRDDQEELRTFSKNLFLEWLTTVWNLKN